MIILIVLVIAVIYVCYKSFKSYRLPKNNLICFTGTLGSGKTYLAVAHALREYKSRRLKHAIYKHFKLIAYIFPEAKHPANLYSNIPIQINSSKKSPIYSKPLTKEHLLMYNLLPEGCVVLIDEIGQFCSQWEFDNPYVMQNIQTLVRFFRHFTNGKMFMTDQVSDNIVKPIRDRIGYIYQLNDFHRAFKVLPFYEVNVVPILALDNGMTNIEQEDITENFFFGFLPYKWLKISHYESRCFKKLYTTNAVREIGEYDELYTTYLIDMSVSTTVKKDYKKEIDKYKDYLYDRFDEDGAIRPKFSEKQTEKKVSVSISDIVIPTV